MQQPRWTVFAAFIAALIALSSVAPVLARHGQVHGIDPADMDLSADPRVDFYRYANGGWLDRTEIPPDEASYGVFQELRDLTTQQLLDLLAPLVAGDQLAPGTDEWKAVRLYEQGIDLATRNTKGIGPIQPTLSQIDGIGDLAALHRFLQGSDFLGAPGMLPVYVSPDRKDSGIYAAYLAGPILGLPNRDYYLKDDENYEQVRAAYVATGAQLLGFLGYDEARARTAAQAVYDFERRLAEPTLTREEARQNLELSYNPRSMPDLTAMYPLMDWPGFLRTLGLSDDQELIVTELKYLQALDGIVRQTPLEAIKDYLRLQLLWGMSGYLSEAIEATAFEFRGKVLRGVEEQRPLEERALEEVNASLGQALGKLYVAEHFPPEAKAQITELVEELVESFRARLEANAWMSPDTKTEAIEKLARLGVKVGYPDRWRTYEAVAVGDSYAETALNAYVAEFRRDLARVGEPVDRTEWFSPPQTVNAFYNQPNNEIVFPAGILQPPFFDYRADPASNFGAIGFVIGHEITHGFDSRGSQFDAHGNLNNWWTPEDRARFDALNERVAEQYSAIEVLPGVFVDGRITVAENVADLGGILVAYDALQNYLLEHGRPLPPPPALLADGEAAVAPFRQEQRFFVAAATVWRIKIRDEALITQVKTGVHSPGRVRATQPARNTDAFFAAFVIGPGDPMYLPPEERVAVW